MAILIVGKNTMHPGRMKARGQFEAWLSDADAGMAFTPLLTGRDC
jgi:hypothetical protein